MKVKIVKGNAVKTVEEIRADAIAYAVSCDDNFVLELIARTLLNYAKRSKHDE